MVAGDGHFEDRESFQVAEAALGVICAHCERFPDAEAGLSESWA